MEAGGSVGNRDGQMFIGVWIPPEDQISSTDKSCVLQTPKCFKDLAGLLKRNPRARFLKFSTEAEAWASLEDNTGFSNPPTTTATLDSPIRGGDKVGGGIDKDDDPQFSTQRRRKGRLSLPAMNSVIINNNSNSPKKAAGEEKDTRFPTPKIQELTAMAREITAKNNSAVRARVEANPKMLINDCDRPTTVQEGCRYNALHVAAKCDNDEIVAYILNKVGSVGFMSTLYPNKSVEAIGDQIRYVTDAYLNTPDKMSNETPLHFGTKFLSVNATKVLVSHPWCNLDAVNCCNETADSIIGTRADAKASSFSRMKSTIQNYFKTMHIIPIWRDPNGFRMAQLGPVAHIRQLGNRIPECWLMKHFPDFEVSLLGPCHKNLFPESKSAHNSSIRVFEECSQWKIQAFAGPTSKECADDLFSCLKQGRCGFQYESPLHSSANASFNFNINSPTSSTGGGVDMPPPQTPPRTPRKRISLGNLHARSPLFNKNNGYPTGQNIHITPPSSPSQSFVSSPALLFEESNNQRLKDVEKGLERFANRIAITWDVDWQENWDWLKFYGNLASEEGLAKVENYLKIVDFYTSREEEECQDREDNTNAKINQQQWRRGGNDDGDDSTDASFSSKYLGSDESPNYTSDNNASFGEKLANSSITSEIVKMMTRLDLNNSASNSSDLYTSSYRNSSAYLNHSSSDLTSNSSSGLPTARKLKFGSPTPSIDSFHSAESDLDDDDDPFLELMDRVAYINGRKPGKKDFQLFSALKDYEDRLSPDKFLLTFQWFNAMKSSGLCDVHNILINVTSEDYD